MIELFLLGVLAVFLYIALYVIPRLEKLREQIEKRKD